MISKDDNSNSNHNTNTNNICDRSSGARRRAEVDVGEDGSIVVLDV